MGVLRFVLGVVAFGILVVALALLQVEVDRWLRARGRRERSRELRRPGS